MFSFVTVAVAEPPAEVALSLVPANAPASSLSTEGAVTARVGQLRKKISEFLGGGLLRRLHVGLTVRDAQTGELMISHNATTPFNPASNTKILTTGAALSVLGADYRYRTVLLGPVASSTEADSSEPSGSNKDGVIHGSVFLQGSGDPSLTPAGLVQLAMELRRQDIHRIEGDVLIDNQFRDLKQLTAQPGAPVYGPGALMINRDSYTVRVEPGSVGRSANAWVDPRSAFFRLHNLAKTVRGKKSRLSIDHSLIGDHMVVTLRGRIGSQRGRVALRKRLGNSTAWATAILSQALADFGITLSGQVRIGAAPPGPYRILAEHLSEPLSEICRIVNKDSNNFVADVIFKTLGAERFGLPGTLEKGARAVAEWLEPQGVLPAQVKVVNGSGLTYENRIRPGDLEQILYRLYHSLSLGPVFLQTLAVGGVDGTIHHRFRGPMVGQVRGKTGTLNGVSVLSGYVGAQPGVLIFTIFVEGFRNRRLDAIRQLQARIVEELHRYLRAEVPVQSAPVLPVVTTPEAAPPESDSEEPEAN